MEDRVKIRVTRGITIADRHLWEPGNGHPPTFAIGDVVDVTRVTAQQLVGMGKAELVSGVLVEPPAYEQDAPEIEVAAVEAPEAAVSARPKRRKAG